MTRPQRSMVTQACPNCGKRHDTSVYVSGQVIICDCGIRFQVRRTDVKGLHEAPTKVARPGREAGVSFPVDVEEAPETADPPPPSDATRPPGPPPEVPGYTLHELLGKGGMGEVWRATQLSLKRSVALKLLPERFSKDPDFVARFEKEATALASVSHPNIVQIIDRGQAGAHYFFVMELVQGITLRERMNRGPIDVAEALRLGAQIARAVESAHEAKVIHRDLKPENVLIDGRSHVKIADFGLAGMHGSEKNIALTATAVAMGTVNYMAPEQRRDAKHVDHRADLYSLGVLLYEMLTGELPIGRFRLPSEKRGEVDPAVDELVTELLDAEPDRRPASAAHVAQLLEQPSSAPRRQAAWPAAPSPVARPHTTSMLAPAASSWRGAMAVMVAVVALAVGVRFWPTDAAGSRSVPDWYADSEDDELFSTMVDTGSELRVNFDEGVEDGGESLNLHAGQWRLEGSALSAVQFGDATAQAAHSAIVPRAYLAHRYYGSDDLEIAADVEVSELGPAFPPVAPEWQRFAEVAFRIKDLQVSVFAIPERLVRDGEVARVSPSEMRLLWRYLSGGREISGNSAQDREAFTEDEMRVPTGRFAVTLRLTKQKGGDVLVEGAVGQRRFAHKVLSGLAGKVGKIALGCRNLRCRFDNLVVRGRPMPKPARPGL